jgi:hypothetical protein
LTTLVTRLTAIIFSRRPSSDRHLAFLPETLPSCPSSLRTAGPLRGLLGQRLDAAVVRKTGAVERHLLDAGGLGRSAMRLPITCAAATLPPLPAPPSCLRISASAVEALASTRAVAGNDGGVDVQVGAVDGQAGHALRRDADARLAGTAKTLLFLGQHDAAPYFFLVSLITTFSSA